MHIFSKGDTIKKNSIVYNLSVLLSAGLVVKTLGLLNRIVLARILTINGMTMYSLMLPTVSLFLGIATFSLAPVLTTQISKNISTKPYSNRDLMIKAFTFATLMCLIISLIHLISNYFICKYLLHAEELMRPFLFFIPIYFFTAMGGVLKGYYHGHKKMNIYAQGQMFEQLFRIISTVTVIMYFTRMSITSGVIASIITLWIGEAVQFLYLAIRTIGFTKIKNKTVIKHSYQEFVPTSATLTGNRLIYSIGNFFEPILFTLAFAASGLGNDVAQKHFGVLHGYVIPIILTASFITQSIQTAILPPLAEACSRNDKEGIRKIIAKSLFLSYIPALAVSVALYYYSYDIMSLTYGEPIGANYLTIMAIPCFICYFEGVFTSSLIATNNSKNILFITIITNLVKLVLVFLLVRIPAINATGLVFAFLASSVLSTYLGYMYMRKATGYFIPIKSLVLSLGFGLVVFALGYFYKSIAMNMFLSLALLGLFMGAFILFYYKKVVVKKT